MYTREEHSVKERERLLEAKDYRDKEGTFGKIFITTFLSPGVRRTVCRQEYKKNRG